MAEKFGGAERRRFKRLSVDFSVRCKVERPMEVVMEVGGEKIEAQMLNLSEEGMGIKVKMDIPEGTVLSMDFMLVYAYEKYENIMQDMQIEGSIVNRAELPDGVFRLGIHFSKIKPEDRKVIIDFVESTKRTEKK